MNNKKKIVNLSIICIFAIISMITINIIKTSYAQEESTLTAEIIDEEGKKEFTNCTDDCNTAKLKITKDGSKVYTIKYEFGFALTSGRKIKVTLKEGLKWVESVVDTYNIVSEIDEEEYKNYQVDSGNYRIESGTKTFNIKDGADVTSGTLSFKISADLPLHITEIENAITISKIENEEIKETVSIDAEIDYGEIEIIINGSTSEILGSTNSEDKNYFPNKRFTGVYNTGADDIALIYKKVEIKMEVPNNTTIKGYDGGGSGYIANAQKNGWECNKNENPNIYTCTYNNRYGKSVGINPIWDFSQTGAVENDEKQIKALSIEYTLYDNSKLTKTIGYYQKYKITSQENVILKPSSNDTYEVAVSNFNKDYPNEIIRLGNVYLANTGRDSEEKTITITFPKNQVGVTYISLPVISGQNISNVQYTLEGSEKLIDYNGELPKEITISGSTSIKYIGVSNELFGTDKYITSIKYKIGSIPFNANNITPANDLFYAGIIKKQSDGTYPTSYETTMLVEGQIHTNSYTYKNNVNQRVGFTSCPRTIGTIKEDKTVITKGYFAGEKINLEYELRGCSSSGVGHTVTSYDPIVYIRIPEKLELDLNSLKITSMQYERSSALLYKGKDITIDNYSIDEVNKNGYNIYKIEFEKNENVYIGYPKYALYQKAPAYLKLNFDLNIPKYYNEKMSEYKYNEVVYLTDRNLKDGTNIIMIGSKGDPYDVDNDNKTTEDSMTYGANSNEYFFITSPSDINSSLVIIEEIKNADDNKEREVETDLKVIKEDSAIIRTKIINNSGVDNQKSQLYIPIPRQKDNVENSIFCKNDECNKYEYDMFLERIIDETNTDKYKIYYGKNIKKIKSYSDIETIEEWYTNYDLKKLTKDELKEINLIKIDVIDVDKNEELNIDINLYTTEKNTTKNLKYNIINSVYYRNLRNQNNEKVEGWKNTNSITIGLEPTEVEIEVPITSNYISIIIIIISIVTMGYGIYLIIKRRKK